MNGTANRQVTWRETYGFAKIVAALEADQIDRNTPDVAVEDAIRALLPRLAAEGLEHLWDAGRIDAAALGQLDDGDFYTWPLVDMDPPRRRTDARFDVLLLELEQSVGAVIREALTKRCPVCLGAGGWQVHDGSINECPRGCATGGAA